MPVSGDLAAGAVVDAVHNQPLEGLRVLHLDRPPEGEALWVSQILPEHVVAGAVRLILHVAQDIVQHSQLIILIDQEIFVRQADILLTLEHRVLRVSVDHIRAVDQLFVARPPGSVVTGNGRLRHIDRKAFSDYIPGEISVKPDKTGIAFIPDLSPLVQDLLHRAVRQHIVRVNAGVQFGVNIGVGNIVGRMHAAIFLVDVLNLKPVIAALPLLHQRGCVIRGTIVHNEPDEVLAALAAKALIGARQGVRAIVGGGENGENNVIHSIFGHLDDPL